MFRKVDDFVKLWENESKGTLRILEALTEKSLAQSVAEDHRTLGRMAWHIVQTIPEMMSNVGLAFQGSFEKEDVPVKPEKIAETYRTLSSRLNEEIKSKWSDADLLVADDLYGEKWERGRTLMILLAHEIHHRAQMTVLMRQAGLKVPGIYGPSKEEWANYGAEPPKI